jgi:hypothetical protein
VFAVVSAKSLSLSDDFPGIFPAMFVKAAALKRKTMFRYTLCLIYVQNLILFAKPAARTVISSYV